MATEEEQAIKSQFSTFSNNAVFEVILPRSADFDVSKIFEDDAIDDLQRAPTRRNVFFDEKVQITLVLKTPANEDDVRALLPSLELSISAHATDAVPQGNGNAASASGKHDLTSKTIPASEFIDVKCHAGTTCIAWTPELRLSRPRARLQRPAVYFTVNLILSAEALVATRQHGKDYLSSLEPLPVNILEALQFDPSLSDTKIYLPETRITKVSPSGGRLLDDVKPIRGSSKRAFPIVPAIFTRVRYSYLLDTVVASLHLETSKLVSGTVLFKDVQFAIPNMTIESLNTFEWPQKCLPADETVLLYKIARQNKAAAPSTVSVGVTASVRSEDDRQIDLHLHWEAQVDLSKKPPKSAYTWARPTTSSGAQHRSQPSIQGASRPTSLDATQLIQSNEHGVLFNFWTPTVTPPKINFKIRVQCINQSDRPRRFALKVVHPKRMTTKLEDSVNVRNIDPITAIFNASPEERLKPPNVFDLNPDVKIGPLPSGACYETEMKFWAASKGVLELGVIRIVDIDTKQTVDVRELPDVVVLDPNAE